MMPTRAATDDNAHSLSPWFDYYQHQQRQGAGVRIPNHVEKLFLGISPQVLASSSSSSSSAVSTVHLELPERAFYGHPNLRHVQIYISHVACVSRFAFAKCPQLERVDFVLLDSENCSGNENNSNTTTMDTDDDSNQPRQHQRCSDSSKLRRQDDDANHNDDSNSSCSILTSIGEYAFHECRRLHTITGFHHLFLAAGGGDGCSSSLEIIGNNAFCLCNSLQSISLRTNGGKKQKKKSHIPLQLPSSSSPLPPPPPSSLHHVGNLAWACCTVLTELDLAGAALLTTIPQCMAVSCRALVVVRLPPRLQWIEASAFGNCVALQQIDIPSGHLRVIGRRAFLNCASLTQVRFCRAVDEETTTLTTAATESLSFSFPSLQRQVLSECPPPAIADWIEMPFEGCPKLHTIDFFGTQQPHQDASRTTTPNVLLWPRILHQFLDDASGDGLLARAKMKNPKSIAWNFLRQHVGDCF